MRKGNPHGRIIKALCKERLLPYGVFEKGASRTYIDDNGYFLTIIEFQPSSWSKGTYLNIALHFLWDQQGGFSYDFPAGPYIRVAEFVAYENDEQFEQDIRPYVELALEKVLFYRTLRDIYTADQYFSNYYFKFRKGPRTTSISKVYLPENASPLYFIKARMKGNRLQRLLEEPGIQSHIKAYRTYLRSKASMKKLQYNEFDK